MLIEILFLAFIAYVYWACKIETRSKRNEWRVTKGAHQWTFSFYS